MSTLKEKLTLTKQQLTDIKTNAKNKMDQEFADQLAESINVDEILTGTDIEIQAKELRKLLIVAGLDIENDMSNPEIMSIINNVLKTFDPTKDEDKEGALFAANFNHFEKKGHGRHRKVLKKVDDDYFVRLEAREKAEAQQREVESKRKKNNDYLK